MNSLNLPSFSYSELLNEYFSSIDNASITNLTVVSSLILSYLSPNSILQTDGSSNVIARTLTNGELLIGNTGNEPTAATLTGTTDQIIVTPAAGSITLSAPQNINTTSSPTFNNMIITNNTDTDTLNIRTTVWNNPTWLCEWNATSKRVGVAEVTSSNNANSVVKRDASGNFSAGIGTFSGLNLPSLTLDTSAGTALVLDLSNNVRSGILSSLSFGKAIVVRTALGDADFGRINLEATTNQLRLGLTNTVTLNSPSPASSRVYSLQDVLSNANFIMSEGTQTINGNKTLSGITTVSNTTDASNITTAGFVNSGGIACAKKMYIGSDIIMTGANASNTGTGLYVGNVVSTNNIAGIQHSALSTAVNTNYAIIQRNDGETFINAPSGQNINMRNNNTDVINIGGSSITIRQPINVTGLTASMPVKTDASKNLVSSAISLTSDTSGILSLANGGTNANLTASNGGIVWSNASQMQILSGTATAGQFLLSGSSATPSWSNTVPNITTISNTTNSTSNTTGCLILSGGLGIASNKDLYLGGKLNHVGLNFAHINGSLSADDTITVVVGVDSSQDTQGTSVSTSANALAICRRDASAYLACKGYTASDTVDSSSTTTGTITCTGGVGISKKLFVGDYVNATAVGVKQGSYMFRHESSDQTISNTTSTILTYTTNDSSNGVTYSAGVFTVDKAGLYACGCGIVFTAFDSNVKRFAIWVTINGNTTNTRKGLQSGSGDSAEVSTHVQVNLSAGDTVTFYCYQNSGGNYTISNSIVQGYSYVQLTGIA